MRENMDEMLTRVREYVFQTDEALKESQRHTAHGTAQHETAALKQIREDIWQLEDKVRAAKWATSPTEQAELANQIDPLMLRVLEKCQKHRDQVQGCQGLLNDIVSWCERGTSAYRFAVHESAVTRGPSRYSSGGGSDPGVQGKTVPSRIPAYKSPTKQPKGQPQQQQQAQSGQQHQLMQVKANSRIPTQPLSATRKSLPDAEQQGSSPDQLAILQGDNRPRRSSSTSSGGTGPADSTADNSGKPAAVGPLTSGAAARIAALNRSAAAAPAAPPAPTAAPARGGGLVAAAAAAFGGSKAAAPKFVAPQRVSSSGGGAGAAPASSTAAGTPAAAAPAASGPAAAPAAAKAAPTVESFMPLDLDAEDGQLLQPPAQQQQQQQGDQQQQQQQERLSRSSGSSVVSLTASRGSGGRSSRSLLQLEPSRDDVSLSSAGQLAQQSTAAEASAAAAAAATSSAAAHAAAMPPTAPPAGGAGGAQQQGAFRFSGSLHGGEGQPGRGLQLRVARPSNTSDASTADFSLSMNDFPEFGPLRSFTPMVSQNGSSGGRSHPFAVMTAPAAGGAAGSSSGYGDRGSLRTSQDISMLLRSGMLMEAALLSSNASRMHVIHDAVAKKPSKPQGEPEVPVVPSRLAVHKKRPWWAQAARVVVGTAAMAVAGAAGAAAAKHTQGEGEGLPGLRPRSGGSRGGKGSSSSSSKQQQPLALEEASSILPFAPLGPAPDASAGCG